MKLTPEIREWYAEMGKKGKEKRWGNTTLEERQAHSRKMLAAKKKSTVDTLDSVVDNK